MEDIELGEYIRTISGNIFQYQRKDDDGYMWGTGYFGCYLKNILKHSKNIIDLIEVGDYVNGCKVHSVDEDCVTVYLEVGQSVIDYNYIFGKDIKSIVTKESFESIKYEV